jgi:hypothetical protein
MSVVAADKTLSAAEHERATSDYGRRAEVRAYALGNCGPKHPTAAKFCSR